MQINLCQTLFIILLALPSVCHVLADDDVKQYLNIQAPETALNAPIVLTLGGKTTLIGLYYRAGKRDVSAMQLEDGRWQPLGENGLEITGVEGNFISSFRIDDKGTPWLLTY